MKFFHLPDLGEGIPEADIVKWHVKEGDDVKEDQAMVSVETAKAVVEVPSPVTGTIAKLCGQPGDTILTGAPLVEFVSDNEDTGTVVGELVEEKSGAEELDSFIIGAASNHPEASHSLSIAGLASLADKYNVNLSEGRATEKPLAVKRHHLANPTPLKGVRKHMSRTMSESHAEVVPVTLFGDADIHCWKEKEDITVRLIKAVCSACEAEPALNAWFDGGAMSCEIQSSVNLGLAVDSADGLFVPVIRSAQTLSAANLREKINDLRESVQQRSIASSELHGSSITLSNFGVFAGTYATPIIVPPSVCIVGAGRLKEIFVSVNGKPESHRILPLSLSFDHRAATGGEASRFLKVMIDDLERI